MKRAKWDNNKGNKIVELAVNIEDKREDYIWKESKLS